MSGYLDHLVDRTLGVVATLQPRPRSRFEPGPVGGLEVEPTLGWTEPPTAGWMEPSPGRGTVPEPTAAPPRSTAQERRARRPGAAPATQDPRVTPDRPGVPDGSGPPDASRSGDLRQLGHHPPDRDQGMTDDRHAAGQAQLVDRDTGRHAAAAGVPSGSPRRDDPGPGQTVEPAPTAAPPLPTPEWRAVADPPVPTPGLPRRITVDPWPPAGAERPTAASPTPAARPSGQTAEVEDGRADVPEGSNATEVPVHRPMGFPAEPETPTASGMLDVGRRAPADRLTAPPAAAAPPAAQPPAAEPLEELTARAGPAARTRRPAVAGRATPGTPARPPAPPKVTVTIGRVEIRPPAVPPPAPEPPAGPQPLSLDEYLDRRGGPP